MHLIIGAAACCAALGVGAAAAVAGSPPPPPPPPPSTGTSSPPPVTTPVTTPTVHRDTTPPPAPVGVAVNVKVPGQTTITWRVRPARDLTTVLVVRALAGNCPSSPGDGTQIGGAAVRSRQVDTSERTKVAYCYTVFEVDKHGLYKGTETHRVVNRGDVTPPAAVTNLNVTHTGSAVDLTWTNPPASAGVAHELVRRSLASAGCPAKPADGTPVGGNTVRTSQIDNTGQAGAAYCYAVFTEDKAGNRASPATKPVTLSSLPTTSNVKPPVATNGSSSLISKTTQIVAGGALLLAALAYGATRLTRRELDWHHRTGYGLRDVARVDLRAYDPMSLVIPVVLALAVVGGLVVLALSL